MLSKMGTIGDKPVDSDSVNLGSNPSSPATQKPRQTGTSDDFGPVERPAESEQNGYARSTEPGTDKDSEIPTEPKTFVTWMINQDWMNWPEDLHPKCERAYQALLMSEHASEAWRHSPATRRLNSADWSAFTTAYAEHKAREAV